jgi:DNA polymerase-1
MKIEANRQEGYQLLQDGLQELAWIESQGFRINVRRLEWTKGKLQGLVRGLRTELEEDRTWALWRRRFGSRSNLNSRDQLSVILHDELGHEVKKTTESGRPMMDEESLADLNHPFVNRLAKLYKYDKALKTFLTGIEREIVDGWLHPVFNLHIARSYRSSSDSPNFQNFPVRDKEISKIIRSIFIARPGCILIENDFKGIEVGVSACYHKDQNFISYITTAGKDMHRDMAAQIYMLKPDQVDKDIRYGAKNKFVFPEFYGDFYVSCARNLWEWIRQGKLKGPKGDSLRDHLRRKGIESLGACDPEQTPEPGTFEHHLKSVENDFWNRRFQQYGRWRKRWFEDYQSKGYFDLLSGFRIHGMFTRNQVINLPVQGSAFHCLLWSLIQVNRQLRRHNMKARIVGQIHDSMIADVPEKEATDYLEIVATVVKNLRIHYKWLIIPLEIECEISPPGKSWFAKKEVKYLGKGVFKHPDDEEKRVFTSRLLEIMNQ